MDSYSNLRARAKCNRFAEHNGIELTLIETDHVEEITVTEAHLNPMGWSTAAVSPPGRHGHRYGGGHRGRWA